MSQNCAYCKKVYKGSVNIHKNIKQWKKLKGTATTGSNQLVEQAESQTTQITPTSLSTAAAARVFYQTLKKNSANGVSFQLALVGVLGALLIIGVIVIIVKTKRKNNRVSMENKKNAGNRNIATIRRS